MTRSADLRYRGQAHQLTVAIPSDSDDATALTRAFHGAYRHAYGVASDAPVEFVSARVRVTHPRRADEPRRTEAAPPKPAVAVETRPVRFVGTGQLSDTPVFDWVRLTPDASVVGPALVTGSDTTVVVPPGATARVDDELNLHLSPDPGATGGSVAPATEP